MNGIKYGILHCHTDNSMRDSVMTVEKLVIQSKNLGAPAVALTDHGVMTGYMEFMKFCRREGMNPIVGVEAYVDEGNEGARHLILMAKDYIGFKALIKAVSESNTRIAKVDGIWRPRMNKDILSKHFGPNGEGHWHVIGTSSCIKGVLATLITTKMETEKKVEMLKTKQKEYESPKAAGFLKNTKAFETLNIRQRQLEDEIAELNQIANRSLMALEHRAQEVFDGSDEGNLAREVLKAAGKEKEMVYMELEAKRQEACWYRDHFGTDNFYIELQYHGIREEKQVMVKLAQLSDRMNVPVCISNNVHMPAKNQNDILTRTIIRTTVNDKWKEPSKADKEKYLKTDEELIAKLAEILPRKKVMEGYENVGRIMSMCDLRIPVKHHYPVFHTPNGSTAEEYLRKRAYEGISWRYPDGNFQDYERLEYELDVICSMGYVDYHCIVEDFLRYGRAAGKLDLKNPEQRKLALSFDTEKIEGFVFWPENYGLDLAVLRE